MIFSSQNEEELFQLFALAHRHLGSVEQQLRALFKVLVRNPSVEQQEILTRWADEMLTEQDDALRKYDADVAKNKDSLIQARARIVALRDSLAAK